MNTWAQQKNFAEETSRVIRQRLKEYGALEITDKQRKVVEATIINMLEHEFGVAADHPSLASVEA